MIKDSLMQNCTVQEALKGISSGQIVYYRSNPGNAGDALIAAGAFVQFERAGLDVEFIDPTTFDSEGKIVIYAGGGNLVGIYPEARDFIRRHHAKAKLLILLPHTVANNDDLLAELGQNAVLFARERVTYEYLMKAARNARVCLDKDLAFHIDPIKVMNMRRVGIVECITKKIAIKFFGLKVNFDSLPRPSMMLKNSIFEFFYLLKNRKKTANFFRNDVEKARSITPPNNADLSIIYEYGTRSREVCMYTASRLLSFINRFDVINTDRLHICIGAALLGKTVHFYPNSYYKCRAVYQYSLASDFKNVVWHEPSEVAPRI